MTPKARHGFSLTEDRQMLVLERHENERIVLHAGGRTLAVVTLVEIDRGRVRIGIQAPAEITIDREEVFRSKMEDRDYV
jgi:carbon storage regulator CsrA